MGISVVHEAAQYRMITDGNGRYAVIEVRNGLVYSLHPRDRREAPDTPEGMAAVAADQWCDHQKAGTRFVEMLRNETRYAETIW
ncbi:MAG TPA: hypothetical protein VEY95_13205 [Azospirillaceae bacterium]|nr:hypothetical protein [Azospirillaceae bacterium]